MLLIPDRLIVLLEAFDLALLTLYVAATAYAAYQKAPKDARTNPDQDVVLGVKVFDLVTPWKPTKALA